MQKPAKRIEAVTSTRDEFATFYAAEHDRQVRRAFLLTGSNETANDIVHDAFIAVYRRFAQLDHPGSYLNQVVLNGCRDLARRQRRQTRLLDRLRPGSPADGEHDVLDDALATLPFNQRAAVVLCFYAQCSHREAADALGCPIGSIGPWIARALAALRKELA